MDGPARPLHVFTRKLAFGPVAEVLRAGGWAPRVGWPGADGTVGVWGASPLAWRGERAARRIGAALLRIEDAWLRSIEPGRSGEAPLGLLIDRGAHFDASVPSDLETMLARHPLDDGALIGRARGVIDRLKRLHLSKYNAHRTDLAPPEPGYVLVVDQTEGDASVRASGADRATFREMLVLAQEEHPGARVLVRAHPETARGYRRGHLDARDESGRVSLLTADISPWQALEGAVAVYTVSSQMGLEAILAGHRPVVMGTPFYAGWGLTDDRADLPRRTRRLTRAQLVAAAYLLHPVWYDPHARARCEVERVIDILEARARAWREDRRGYVALDQRLWKRRHLQAFFGGRKRVLFERDAARAAARAELEDRRLLVWGSRHALPAWRVEDGFLRSRGLGAELIPPLSLALDDLGIYYDPSRPSRLDALVKAELTEDERLRAERLARSVVAARLTKYNVGAAPPDLPRGRRVLVPGQVEDDASILLGAGSVRTDAALLAAAREANPDAVLIYKPHPDVEAGLREGGKGADGADVVARGADMSLLLDEVDEVWTITSLTGFEALLRGRRVTCLGMPFYAGWGLTRDLAPRPGWRDDRDLAALVHAALIAYPRYHDPVLNLACPPETAVRRLVEGRVPRRPALRLVAKAQGVAASQSWLWRQR